MSATKTARMVNMVIMKDLLISVLAVLNIVAMMPLIVLHAL